MGFKLNNIYRVFLKNTLKMNGKSYCSGFLFRILRLKNTIIVKIYLFLPYAIYFLKLYVTLVQNNFKKWATI